MPKAERKNQERKQKGTLAKKRNAKPKPKPQQQQHQDRFLCKRCNRRIRIPEGWSFGPAVRKHYWAKHLEIMQTRRAGSHR